MRDNIPLHQIRREVMIEAGLSDEPGESAFSKDRVNHMINQTERLMASQDNWPIRRYEITGLVAGDAQFTDFPEGVTPDSLRDVHVRFGDQWLPMTMGISPADRSVYTETMRSAPAMKWDINVARPGQFEVWPIGSNAQTVMFRGQRVIGGMKDENDTCVLDADVIALRVAAVILAGDKSENAAYKLRQAEMHTQNVLKKLMSSAPSANLGARQRMSVRPGIDFISPGGA